MDLNSPDTWRWVWLAVAVTFAVGEIAVAGSFFLMPFAIGGLAAALVSFAGGSVTVGWLVFVAVSAVATAVLRPLSRRLDRSSPVSDVGANRWVGRQGQVLEDIPAGVGETGLVRLEREQWRAGSVDGTAIAAGAVVVVIRVDGTRLLVVPADSRPGSQNGG